jgi:predicted secreted protein
LSLGVRAEAVNVGGKEVSVGIRSKQASARWRNFLTGPGGGSRRPGSAARCFADRQCRL